MAAEAASHIDQGFLKAITTPGGNHDNVPQQPVLQCVQVKPLGPPQGGGQERFRVVFSDVDNFVQSMLATQANHYITEGKLRRGVLVRLKSFNLNQVKGKQILIVLDLEVLDQYGEFEKIGEPKSLEVKPEGEAGSTITSNGFYGSKPAATNQPAETRLPARTNGASHSAHGNIHPIESLSPYGHKWTIKARVTSKSDIKTWHNKNGEGKLFSVNLLDETGEIRATGFNDQCDAFYDLMQEGSVFYISSPCRVQLAKKQFSNLNNDYELTFERDTRVEKAEESSGVPQVRFNFTNIGNLQSIDKDAVVDVIGVLKDVGETTQITSKTTSKPYDKRELTLVDNTQFSVRLTIWGNTASSFAVPVDSVVAFKGVKVSDFGGRSLSLLSSGTMSIDPDIDEAHTLKGWYEASGRTDSYSTHAGLAGGAGGATGRTEQLKTINQVKEERLGQSEQPDYFSTKATIVYVRQDNFAYASCLSPECNKKVVEIEPGSWRCERCDKSFPKPEYRYIMSINVSDFTGQVYLSCFDDVGRMIMGMSADELMQLKEEDRDKDVFQNATCQTFTFRCRAKMDTYQEQQRVRYQVMSATPLNLVSECAKLAEMIKLYD